MGQLKHEGQAVNVVAPDATAMNFGEVYRIDGWTGIAMREVSATDTERGLALETSNRIWYFKVPSGLTVARGALLYWSSGTGFKSGQTDLQTTTQGTAVAKCEEAKDSNNVVAGRVLNNAPAS